ncbi:hypothetical protein CROQUDRAFT_37983 [Cronartium quercuum f. sp. fusiforme G11]|uniref:Enoyl reductase (ER) domain-containing protein n=1 Tax=Cronartium quercuum f. sp. fusiforme G11 TaxID=708437 RepID=A0A9P6NRD7_9BASI|nr:hypothetical protein CROQUDRAFT_37983 [Cronartium quercuum f. sp. fusiforme G11]
MTLAKNPAVIFSSPPSSGYPLTRQHLTYSDANQIDTDTVDLEGGVLLRNRVVSIDPYQRGRMRAPEIKSHAPPFTLGKPITNFGVGRVLRSEDKRFKVGDEIFTNLIGFEAYTIIPKEGLEGMITRVIDQTVDLPVEKWTGAAGMPGMTAYYGFYEIGAPKKGETIFISAASGAVGQIVGQLAKREGLKVIGSCGSDEKVEYLKNELDFDYAFNYKTCKTLDELKKFEPINIYWDSVGGETLDDFFLVAANQARIVACGMISKYNVTGEPYGIKNLMLTSLKSIKIEGFIITQPEIWKSTELKFLNCIPKWLVNGEMKSKEDVTKGLENAIESVIGIFKGHNFGKAVVEIWNGN